jgi:uncharacterized protein
MMPVTPPFPGAIKKADHSFATEAGISLCSQHLFAGKYPMPTTQKIIVQTQKWIADVVVACHFCPFAAQAIKAKKIHYEVAGHTEIESCLGAVLIELARLEDDSDIETAFLIFPAAFAQFDDFLGLVALAEQRMKQKRYSGIYQLASFHPLYRFAGADDDDAANYTNRSVYPMLHFLREASIDKALEQYKNPENIPVANVALARAKGLAAMSHLRESCF